MELVKEVKENQDSQIPNFPISESVNVSDLDIVRAIKPITVHRKEKETSQTLHKTPSLHALTRRSGNIPAGG